MGVLATRALVFGVYVRAPSLFDFPEEKGNDS